MNIEIANKFTCCSTLLASGLKSDDILPDEYVESLEDFKEVLIYHLTHNKYEDHMYKTHGSHKFSFLMASTNSKQPDIQEYFRELGFQETPEVHNSKNSTYATLFFIGIPQLYETLGIKVLKNEE